MKADLKEALRLIESNEVQPTVDPAAALDIAERLRWLSRMAAYRAAQVLADALGGQCALSAQKRRQYAENVEAGVRAALERSLYRTVREMSPDGSETILGTVRPSTVSMRLEPEKASAKGLPACDAGYAFDGQGGVMLYPIQEA